MIIKIAIKSHLNLTRKKAVRMAKMDPSHYQMDQSTQVKELTTRSMEKESKYGPMAPVTKATGKMTKQTVSEL